jgi:hypothetical protein
MGEPFLNEFPLMLAKGLLGRGGPMRVDADGLLADCGLRS